MESERFDSYTDNPYSWEDMRWVTRQSSKGEIDRAGDALIALVPGNPARDAALVVINNWRSCHAYPLQVIKMLLLQRSKKIDTGALVSQRLKRLPSIALKLKQNPNMKLSQMQDIGGCRSVLGDISRVIKLTKVYKTAKSKSPHHRSILVETYDYIAHPKEDGYRGIHLIYKYQSDSKEKAAFVGQRIEIQIRSKMQHTWATAVETAQTFTGQALKSRIKSANKAWLRFFALMGSAIAEREKKPNIPGTPVNGPERIRELREIVKKEKILTCLFAWNDAIHELEITELPGAHAFLLELNPAELELEITPYAVDELSRAQEDYLRAEKNTENDPLAQVVLVSVDSLDALRRAYPNYYADTTEFIDLVNREIQ